MRLVEIDLEALEQVNGGEAAECRAAMNAYTRSLLVQPQDPARVRQTRAAAEQACPSTYFCNPPREPWRGV